MYLIIGNSIAGIKAAETLRSVDPSGKITIISDEKYPVYSKVLLTDYIAGKIPKSALFLRPKNFYKSNRINILYNCTAEEVFPDKHKVLIKKRESSTGRVKYFYMSYKKLLVATGASPKFPDIPGIDLPNVFGFRTLDDAENIIEKLKTAKNIVLVGGGLVNCKIASALSEKKNLKITIVVSSDRLLSQMLDEVGSKIILSKAKEKGINVKFNTDVVEIIGSNLTGKTNRYKKQQNLQAVKLSDGKFLPADIVVVGKGVKPNIEMFSKTKLKINRGIITDSRMQTNLSDIFAAGDVAETYDFVYSKYRVNAMWPNAVRQAEIAALNMSGNNVEYKGSFNMNAGDFFGVSAISFGIIKNEENKLKEEIIEHRGFYEKILFDESDGRKVLKGYICVCSKENIFRIRKTGYLQSLLGKGIQPYLVGYSKIRQF